MHSLLKTIWAGQKSEQAAQGHHILQNSKEENETKEKNTDTAKQTQKSVSRTTIYNSPKPKCLGVSIKTSNNSHGNMSLLEPKGNKWSKKNTNKEIWK